jgi:signal transduction histidine kinase
MGSNAESIPGPAVIAPLLSKKKEQILKTWEKNVLRDIPAARQYNRSALRDHLPAFLDDIARALKKEDCSNEVLEAAAKKGANHGEERAIYNDYTLGQVLTEFGLFRKAIFEVLEQEATIERETRDIILELLEKAIAESAAEYTEIQFSHEKEAKTQAEYSAKRLQGLHTVTEAALVSNISVEPLLNDLVIRIREFFAADAVGIFLQENFNTQRDDSNLLSLRSACGIADEDVGNFKVKPGEGFLGQAYEKLTGMIIPDLTKETPLPDPLYCLGSAMIAPIKLVHKKLGLAYLATSEARVFSPDDLILFELIADRIAVAIEHTLLYDQVRENEKHYRSYTEKLKQEQTLRENFVASISHDLRNPLASIKMNLSLVRKYPERPEARERLLARVDQSVNRVLQMIEDLLDVNEIKAGKKLPIQITHCDLKAICEEVIEDMSLQYGNRFKVFAPQEARGFWSAPALRRVIENLLNNAVKYGDPEKEIELRLTRKANEITLSVHNWGEVIPPEDQATLFLPFHRAEHVQASGKSGWGLGLAIVQGLVDAHGGKVTVSSLASEGTLFMVSLPIDARA